MGPFYENRSLFSDHYLAKRLPERPAWREADVEDAWEAALEIYHDAQDILDGLNEAQTEQEFIRPVLRHVLGWSFGVQKARRYQGRLTRPDYGLFLSDRDKRDAQGSDSADYWSIAASVGDAKYWGRPLDREGDPSREAVPELSRSNPSFQIVSYLIATGCEWGILTNGKVWRLYFAGARSRLDTYYEVNLERVLTEGDEEAFRAFLLFFRADAFRPDPGTGRTFLESVHEESARYGTRLERRLKDLIFEEIFLDLAQGFLDDWERSNGGVAITQEVLDEVFHGTVRLLYRLLFLLHAEARELLPVRDDRGYGRYSFTGIKQRVAKLIEEGATLSRVSTETWNDLTSLFEVIDQGDPDLNVPQYNGGLFQRSHPANAFLNDRRVADKHLVPAIHALTREPEGGDGQGRFIDYKSLDVEQLGSIYEGLLEFRLRQADEELGVVREDGLEVYRPIDEAENPVDVVHEDEIYLENDRGERKSTGSYYTPHPIVEEIVERTVGPVLQKRQERFRELVEDWQKAGEEERETLGEEAVEALLGLKVCDPAMGSGHFLVYTVNWLSEQLAAMLNEYPVNPVLDRLEEIRNRIVEELESQDIAVDRDRLKDVNLLKRMVMKRCIYGVDLNPMAVELAKLSLWLDSFTVGAPLSFLDHHLKQGNSLIGTGIEEVRKEVLGSGPQATLFGGPFAGMLEATELMRKVSYRTDVTLTEVNQSAELFAEFENEIAPYKRVLDLWTVRDLAGEDDDRRLMGDRGRMLLRTQGEDVLRVFASGEEPEERSNRELFELAERLRAEKSFFHWELEFPEVFVDLESQDWRSDPGFDAVIGNPPYGDILPIDERQYLEEVAGVTTSGRSEIYTGFLVVALDVLRHRRQTAYIFPNTMLDGPQFATFRADVTEKATPVFVRDFRSLQVFEEAEALTMIMVLRKEPTVGEWMVPCKYWDPRHNEFRRTELAVKSGSKAPWRPVDPIVQRIEGADWSVKLEPGVAHCHDAGVDYKWKDVGWNNRGERQPLSKVLMYEGDQKHPEDHPLVKGEHIEPYRVEHEGDYVIHDWETWKRSDTTVLVYLDLAQVPAKVVSRQTADRPIAAVDRNQYVTAKSVHTTIINEDDEHEPEYVAALLNSTLMHYVYEARIGEAGRTFAQVRVGDLRELPIRAVRFETDGALRDQQAEQGWSRCEAVLKGTGTVPAVVDFVEQELGADPERSDVVHDVLVRLASRMEELAAERARLDRVLNPFKFLDRSVDFEPLPDALAKGIKYGEPLDTGIDLAEVHHDLDELRLRRDGQEEWMLEAQLKLRDPETGWEDWLREEDGSGIQRQWVPVFRMPLDEERGRYYEHALRVRSEFVNAGSLPGGYTRSTMTKLRKAEVPAFDDTSDLNGLVDLTAELEETERRHQLGRALIDAIVFRLYNCDDQEVQTIRERVGA